ncbi:MAG: GNAT family N-acetyltransferase [Promethearchaeota archaeon]
MIVVRLMDDGDEEGVALVIRRSFNSAGAHASPYPDKRFIVVAEVDGRIVAHASIRPIITWFQGTLVPCGILHMVGTDPDYQHQGIGTKVLEKCVEVMKREHLLISLLMTPVPRFYAILDWISLHPKRDHVINREQAESVEGDDAVELEEFPSPADLDSCLAMREAFASNHDLFVHSNRQYFDMLVEPYVSASIVNFIHVIKREGKAIGYLFGTRDSSAVDEHSLGIIVHEIVCRDYYPGLVASILKYLLEFDDEFNKVQFHHPLDEKLVIVLEGMGAVPLDHGLQDMFRINSLELLCASLEEQFNTSWMRARETQERLIRNCIIETDDERVLFQFTNNYLNVVPKVIPASFTPTFKTDRKTFTRIIAGMSPASILLEGNNERSKLYMDAISQLECIFKEKRSSIRYNTHYFPAHSKELDELIADVEKCARLNGSLD